MSPSRAVLMVGEGNFSFSASACQLYSGSETTVTATCLQHQEEALRHEGAADNIQTIKDSGGTVLFEVDCTKLDECASLQGHRFDRVVFNFPHYGRKSGVKKNRELLRNFFLSCVQVLAEGGEVHVSLCNGQGGTPADQPKREWHNSWQAVAMAAEADLILSAIHPFENDKHQSYKCTGYRSQDKGFHVEKALVHMFTRSIPYTPAHLLKVEEVVEGEKVQYEIPAELSDYIFRRFLCSDSVHPVKLVQDFLLEGLMKKWPVSMMTETIPFLLTAKQLQTHCCGIDSAQCYWIHLLQKDLTSDTDTSADKENDPRPTETLLPTCLASNKGDRLLAKKEAIINADGNEKDDLLYGISGVVFRNVPIGLWAMPAFHELLIQGVFPSESEPGKLLGEKLETLLAPFGVSIVTEQGGLRLKAQPVGLVGKVFASDVSDNNNHVRITASLNLDLLAVLLFSLPDWRLLWSHDPRFLKQFSSHPSPGTPFHPFCLYPEPFIFDISFWTGPTWEEKNFHAVVREASCGTVEQVKLIDRFSHPDLSQTSYCYRLIYHSHTHALSHTRALQFHKHLETLLSSRLQVTIR
uniref:Ferredoxin-fold anticodon binding domain containing 1 n=1 Tax=Neolamprologus brichardi TaxID=32507 RepID=A0A3Q4GYH9_NEOBR